MYSQITKDQCAQQIRYFAHLLDVTTQHQQPDLIQLEKYATNLEELLTEWYNKKYLNTRDIVWAKDRLNIYQQWKTNLYLRIDKPLNRSYNNDLLSLIENRKSIRFWEPKSIPRKVIKKILKAGISAPSAFNRQPWKFVVIENTLQNMISGDSSNNSMLAKAPVQIHITIDTTFNDEQFAPAMDAALCAQNMLLAAHQLNLGGCLIYRGELIDQDEFRHLYQLPDSYYNFLVIVLGYPVDFIQKPERANIDDYCIFTKTK